jgi:hypothetical protein
VRVHSGLQPRQSPKIFTQPHQLICLILKAYTTSAYRCLMELLALMPAVYEAIGLRQLPDYSTLWYLAEPKDVLAILDRCLTELVKDVGTGEWIVEAADSTGLDVKAASMHFMAASAVPAVASWRYRWSSLECFCVPRWM